MNNRYSTAWACVSLILLSGCVIERAIPKWDVAPAAMPGAMASDSLAPRPALVIDNAAEGAFVDATIDGQPVRLRIESGHAGVVLNPDAAARVGLKPSIFGGYARVGTVKVGAETTQADVAIGEGFSRQRVMWFERPITHTADGVISMADLPFSSVTLRWRPDRPDDAEFTLPTAPRDYSIVHRLAVGERMIDVRFVSGNPRTFVTTAAGAHLAEHHGGRWTGGPQQHVIAFDVERSVRPMVFAQPMAIGGLRVGEALVRLRDYQGKKLLPADPEPHTGDDIVVSGAGRRSDAEFFITVGQDLLHRCATMTYTAATRDLTFRCPAPG